MKITAVTITSDTRETIIGDALRSVIDWVDEVLIVHLPGLGSDGTLDVARSICGEKMRVIEVPHTIPWAEIRNISLRSADGDWAVVLDTDERIRLGLVDIRTILAAHAMGLDVMTVPNLENAYDKERFFRLPFKGQFVGGIHEQLRGVGVTGRLGGVVFSEVPKDRDIPRLLAGLEAQAAEEPWCERWGYQQGASLEMLGRFEEAIKAYSSITQTGWVRFCRARCLSNMQQHQEAFDLCLESLGLFPTYAEFPWLMGWQCLGLGKPLEAIAWARMAQALKGYIKDRTGIREPLAFGYGPAQVIEKANQVIKGVK